MKISLLGPIDEVTGYGQTVNEIARRLPALLGCEMVIRPTKPVNPAPEIAPMVKPGENECAWEIICHPATLAPTAGKKTIYVTVGESTRLPAKSVAILNQCAAVITHSDYCAVSFSASGVNVPIYVVPQGFDPAVFHYRPMPDGVFTFGCAGKLRNGPTRKGVREVIRLFKAAFPNGEKVRLKVKIFPNDPPVETGDERIELVRGVWDSHTLANWMASCHCWVSLATGGFELMPLQAMALGRPVISHRFGGISEYLTHANGLLVKHELAPAGDVWKGHGLFAKASDGHAMLAMGFAHSSPDYITTRGIKAMSDVQRFTWVKFAHRMRKVVENILNAENLSKCVVQLGRHGDLLNILPAIREMSLKEGRPIPLVVSYDYLSTATGLSYVSAFPFKGKFEDLNDAIADVRGIFREVLVSQVFGKDYHYQTECEHFNEESYRLIGMQSSFRTAKLVMDNRDFVREAALAEKVLSKDKPNVLVNLTGNSSPFPAGPTFLLWLRQRLPDVNLVDIGAIKAESIQDLLGLYDCSCCLITIDTATLHLARSHPIPVIALVRGGWHGTEPVCNYISAISYDAAWANIEAICDEVERKACFNYTHPRLIHLWQDYVPKMDAIPREAVALLTWQQLGISRIDFSPSRFSNAQEIGETVNAPDLKAVLTKFITENPHDIILLSNNDVCVFPDAVPIIREAVNRWGCYYSQRIDVDRVTLPLDPKLRDGHAYAGADLFAFTYDWWMQYRDKFPNLYFGFEGFDFVLQRLMEESGFVKGKPVIVHEKHESSNWKLQNERPAQKHNRSVCRKWAKENVYAEWLLPEGSDFLFKAHL